MTITGEHAKRRHHLGLRVAAALRLPCGAVPWATPSAATSFLRSSPQDAWLSEDEFVLDPTRLTLYTGQVLLCVCVCVCIAYPRSSLLL